MKIIYFICTFFFSFYFNLIQCGNILFLSDVHLDILYNSQTDNSNSVYFKKCKNETNYLNNILKENDYGRFMCNPTEVMLKTTLTHIKNTSPDLDLIILGGDLISHSLFDIPIKENKEINKKLYKDTFQTIYSLIKAEFPSTKIIPILGNNDFYEHYDTPEPISKREQIYFLKTLFFNNSLFNVKEDFNKKFLTTMYDGYYYTYKDNKLEIKIIVLNTNIYSTLNTKFDERMANNQIDFLKSELQLIQEENSKCLIIFHIPPFPHYYRNNTHFFFMQKYVTLLEDIFYQYKDSIINLISGHLHFSKLGVRVKHSNKDYNYKFEETNLMHKFLSDNKISKSDKFFPMLSLPGLSPVNYNNPGYTIIQFDSIYKRIENILTYHADLKKTLNLNLTFSNNIKLTPNELYRINYNFVEDFKFKNFDSDDLYDFIYNRINDDVMLNKFQLYMSGHHKESNEEELSFFKLIMSKTGMIDFHKNSSSFKCAMKILYYSELINCD